MKQICFVKSLLQTARQPTKVTRSCNRCMSSSEARLPSTTTLHSYLPRRQALFGSTITMSATTRSSSLSSSDMPRSSDALLRVALCQFPVTEHKHDNQQTATEYIQQAAAQGAQLVVLPEIWNSPYATAAFPDYAEELPDIGSTQALASPTADLLRRMAVQQQLWIVGGSVPERDAQGKIYNTCLVINPDGKVVAKHRKVHLFDINVPGRITFFESDTLSPGQSVSYFAIPWGNIGVGICYDIRFAEYAMLLSQKHACRILIYPGAFNMTTGPAHWELLQRARAVDNQCFILSASPARTMAPTTPGKYPHYTAWGHSMAVSPWGELIASIDEKPGIVMADLDLGKVDDMRRSIPIFEQKRHDMYKIEAV